MRAILTYENVLTYSMVCVSVCWWLYRYTIACPAKRLSRVRPKTGQCTLDKYIRAPPGEYYWTIRIRRRYGLSLEYYCSTLFTFEKKVFCRLLKISIRRRWHVWRVNFISGKISFLTSWNKFLLLHVRTLWAVDISPNALWPCSLLPLCRLSVHDTIHWYLALQRVTAAECTDNVRRFQTENIAIGHKQQTEILQCITVYDSAQKAAREAYAD